MKKMDYLVAKLRARSRFDEIKSRFMMNMVGENVSPVPNMANPNRAGNVPAVGNAVPAVGGANPAVPNQPDNAVPNPQRDDSAVPTF